MNSRAYRVAILAAGIMAVSLASGCSQYVKKADFDAAIAKLQQADQNQQQQIDALSQKMQSEFSQYDARISKMQGRVNVDTVAHFAFNDATLRDEDKPALEDFAKTIKEYHPNVLITVEGFADPAGTVSYNKKLGMKRAEAVRDFLVSSGLSSDQVRAVSYGEAKNRQVVPGATHDKGMDNRRVALTVDFAGPGALASAN